MMKKFFWIDLKRAFLCKGFYLAFIIICLIFARAIEQNIPFDLNPSCYEIIVAATALSGFTPFAAIFPSIAYSIAFSSECSSGYIKMIAARMEAKKFAKMRIITVGFTGGLIIALPMLIMCLLAYSVGEPGMPTTGLYQGTRIEYYITHYGDWYVLCGKVILGFLFGAIWSICSLAFAAWTCNKYMALICPFIVYELMWVMFYKIKFINPIFLIRGDDIQSYPLAVLMEIVYIALMSIAAYIGIKRRMKVE